MTRARNTADTQTASGGPVPPFTVGKNKIINGDFRVNQRAFASTTTTATFGFDRFLLWSLGGTTTYSAQTFTAGTAPVSGYEAINFARLVTASQSASGDYCALLHRIEDVRTLANQVVTFSFWAKASSGTPNIGVTFTQNFGSGGSSPVNTSPDVKTITSSWARYSFQVTLPSISGKTIGTNNSLEPWIFTSVGTSVSAAGYAAVGIQNVTIDIWGLQVEAGPVATPFQTATGTIQGELAACQRYYYRTTTGDGHFRASGFNITTAIADVCIPLQTTMRMIPTSIDVTGTAADYAIKHQNTTTNCSAVPTLLEGSWNSVTIRMTVASGLTLGQGCQGRTNASGYVGWSAEL